VNTKIFFFAGYEYKNHVRRWLLLQIMMNHTSQVLLAGCWWLICSERKVLLAGG
jgi:hypothetical protein